MIAKASGWLYIRYFGETFMRIAFLLSTIQNGINLITGLLFVPADGSSWDLLPLPSACLSSLEACYFGRRVSKAGKGGGGPRHGEGAKSSRGLIHSLLGVLS